MENQNEKNITELVFVIDESGSMSGLEEDTIGGFNSMINKQKESGNDVYVTTTTFNTYITNLYIHCPINEVKPMTKDDYNPNSCTALLDAIGKTIKMVKNNHKTLSEEQKPNKVLFVITTDGQENSSKSYNMEEIQKKVTKMQNKHGWEFVFLGANIDAIATASGLGIRADRAANFDCEKIGLTATMDILGKMVSCFSAPSSSSFGMQDYLKEINETAKK